MNMKILGFILSLAILAVGFTWNSWRGSASREEEWQAEPLARGDLTATVSATGTLEPEDVIDVGAKVAGEIQQFGIDPYTKKSIDYGSHVEPGSMLALIDDSLYKARADQSRARVKSAESKVDQAKAKVDSAKAKVEQAKANVKRAEADLLQTQAKYAQADRDWERARRLGPRGTISQLDYDTAQAVYETNKALVGVAEASILQAKAAVVDADAAVVDAIAFVGDMEAAVSDSKAMLRQDEINLSYCTIRSPVKGVIIDRRVTLGQTVQSSFNTPSLFLLARDLKRMKVWASVNEADIGQVHVGQPVTFTVDAYPGETFNGEVSLIRYNATMTQNVVTYTVEIVTDNSSGKLLPVEQGKLPRGGADAPPGKLLPYLTAHLKVEVGRKENVLLIPNAALRWQPAPQQVAPSARADYFRPRKRGEKDGADQGMVWVPDNGYVRPVRIKVGLTDGTSTEMIQGELEEGTDVVTNDARPAAGAPAGDGTTNPFAPTNPFGGRRRSP